MITIIVTTRFMLERACRRVLVFEVNERFITLIFFRCNVIIIEDTIINTIRLQMPRMIEACTQTNPFDKYKTTASKEHIIHRVSEHKDIDVTVRYGLLCNGYTVNKYLTEQSSNTWLVELK